MAPPGNQAANRENKLQPIAMEDPGLLDKSRGRGSWQVRTKEMSANEPLMRCRNIKDEVKTELLCLVQDKFRRNLFTA